MTRPQMEQQVRDAERRERIAMQDGTVYVVAAAGTPYVKIGHTIGDVKSRLDDLQVGCPHLLEHLASWPGGRTCESFIHDMLMRFGLHHRGEWFILPHHAAIRQSNGVSAAAVGVNLAHGFVDDLGGWEAVWQKLRTQLSIA